MERNFTVKYLNQHFYGLWQTAPGDCGYLVQISDGEKVLSEVRIEPPLPEEGALLYTPKEVQEGKEYLFLLKVIAEEVNQRAKIPDYTERLMRLKEMLQAHVTSDGSYLVNAATTEDEALVNLLVTYLGKKKLLVSSPAEPKLRPADRILYVAGANIEVWFYVDDDFSLQMTVCMQSPEVRLFEGTALEEIEVGQPERILTSYAHMDAKGRSLEPGLSFWGTLALPVELNTADAAPAAIQTVLFGGLFSQTDAGIHFSGINAGPLKDFVIHTNFGTAFSLENPGFFAQINEKKAAAYLNGWICREEKKYAVQLLLPVQSDVTIRYADLQDAFPSPDLAYRYIEGTNASFTLPPALRSTDLLCLKDAGMYLSAAKLDVNRYWLCVGGNGKPVPIISDRLSLTDWSLTCQRIECLTEEDTRIAYAAMLRGNFSVADYKAELEAVISTDSDWSMTLSCVNGSWLGAIAELLGFSMKEIDKWTGFLKKAETETTMVHLRYDPMRQRVAQVFFQMSMQTNWTVIPSLLFIERLALTADLQHEEQWHYTFRADGIIRIGTGESAAEIFVGFPIQEKMTAITIKTKERGIRIPSFTEILKAVGITDGETFIPGSFVRLDDLRISKLEITARLSPSAALDAFSFGLTTERVFDFSVGSLHFSVNKLEVLLDSLPAGGCRFMALGEFSLFGLLLHLQLWADSSLQGFLLYASLTREEVGQITFSGMADSFVDEAARKYENLPLPEQMMQLRFEEAAICIRTQTGQYLMTGAVKGLGNAVFLAEKQKADVSGSQEPETASNGYIFGAALTDDFTFRGISPALKALDSVLKIQKAGFLLSSFDVYRLSELTAAALPDVRLPELPNWEGELKRGVFLYGTFIFFAPVFENLLRLGSAQEGLVLTAYAYLPAQEAQTEIFASLNEFHLLGLFTFRELSLRYRMLKTAQFDLNGTLELMLGESMSAFTGVMHVEEKTAYFSVETEDNLLEPLGMPGVELKNLFLKMNLSFPDETTAGPAYELSVGGTAAIGETAFTGNIFWQDNAAKVCSIVLDKPFNIDDLFAAVFTAELWPKGLLAITVESGYFYYAREDCQIGPNVYTAGFHIKSLLCLYGFSFRITGSFTDESFEITGNAVNAISLGVLTISGQGGAGGPGVKFLADNNQKVLGLTGGIGLFGEHAADIDLLGYDFTSRCFKGEIVYRGSVELFQNAAISFIWKENEGVQIVEFPMQFIDQTLKYAKLLEDAAEAGQGACGKLTGLFFEEIVQTRFQMEPSFGGIEDGRMLVQLQPRYTVSVAGKTIITASMNKLKAVIPKPETIGLEGLARWVIQTVLDNAGSIAQQLLSDGEGMLRLISAVGAVKGTEAALRGLLCYGGKEITRGSLEIRTITEAASEAESQAAAGMISEAAAAAGGAGAAATAAGGWFESAMAFFGGLLAGFTLLDGKDAKEEISKWTAETQKREQEAAAEEKRARDAVRKMLVMKELAVSQKKLGALWASWSGIPSDDLDIEYHIQVKKGDVPLPETVTKENDLEIPIREDEEMTVEICAYAVLNYPEKAGMYSYVGDKAISSYDVRVLTIITESLPDAEAGQEYSCTLRAQGGAAPLAFNAEGLPAGLILENARISGVPRFSGGQSYITVSVSDALKRTAKKSFWLSVK